MNRSTKIVPVLFLTLAGLAVARQEKSASPAPDAALAARVVAQQLPTYPLTTCPISHDALDSGGKPVDLVHEGRLVRLCCKGCVKDFQKDPATAAATFEAIDAGVIAAQKASYPLATCPVSGEKLGGMDEPLDVVYGTRLVRLCCKGCVKGFQKDPAKVLAQIDAALIEKQKASYPLATCLVSGEKIERDGFDQLYGVRLTRLCCEKCAASFAKDPAKYLALLDKAEQEKNGPKKN